MTWNRLRRTIWILPVVVSLVVIAGLKIADTSPGEHSPLSPSALCFDDQGHLLLALRTANRIAKWNLETKMQIGEFQTSEPPTGIISDQNFIYITSAHSQGFLTRISQDHMNSQKRIKLGFGSRSPVMGTFGNYLYVANQFSDDISVIDVHKMSEIARIPVLRQPFAQDISRNGKYLFVANFLPETRADLDTVRSSVSVISTEFNKKILDIPLANGSNALRDLKLTTDGDYVLISHNLGRFQVPTTQLEQGWMNTSALSIIDARNLKLVATILLDEPDRGAAGSWGIETTDNLIIVAHSGTHDISVINYLALKDRLDQTADKQALAYDLSFLIGIRTRYPVKGNGPRAIQKSGDQLFIANYFSDNISIFDLRNLQLEENSLSLNPGLINDSVRLGEIAFHDASHCFQEWQACTGCHPNDARVDGLNWDLLNDGLGNPKNCKSLMLAHATPPAMITGIRRSAEVAVRAGFKYIQFAQFSENLARSVDLYLASLQPVPSPNLINGNLSKSAKKGKHMFDKLGCINCHPPPLYTNRKMASIGEPDQYNDNNTWDTPTLLEVWRTGPYLHNGRCATLEDVIKNERHGVFTDASEDDLDCLVEFVKSL